MVPRSNGTHRSGAWETTVRMRGSCGPRSVPPLYSMNAATTTIFGAGAAQLHCHSGGLLGAKVRPCAPRGSRSCTVCSHVCLLQPSKYDHVENRAPQAPAESNYPSPLSVISSHHFTPRALRRQQRTRHKQGLFVLIQPLEAPASAGHRCSPPSTG